MRKKPLYNWIFDAICFAMIVATFVIVIVRWQVLPEEIPTHFDFNGNVNGYGGKGTLLVMPIVALVMFAVMSIVEFFPQSWNTGVKITALNAAAVYKYIRMMIVSLKLLTVLLMCSIAVLLCYAISIPVWLTVIYIVLMTAAIIFFLVKASRVGKR